MLPICPQISSTMINNRLSGYWMFILLMLIGQAPQLYAQEKPIAFTGARIYPISAPAIDNGVVVMHQGKITAIGPVQQVKIPEGATVHDVKGKVVMPGLVDTHSHLGQPWSGDASTPLHPDNRVLDAVNVGSDDLNRALAGGLTTLNIMSGSGHLMSGQTVYIKLREGKIINDLVFCEDLNNDVCGGMKMANGTNSMRSKPPFPGSRAKSAALVRSLFVEAQNYRQKLDQGKKDPEKMPARNIRLEPIIEIMEGKRVVHFHTHRHDDVMTAIRLSQEFGFKVVLHHVSEAWKIADEIAKAKVSCSLILVDAPGGKLEAVDIHPKNGKALEQAGVLTAFHTDDHITDSRLFFRMAAIAVREGMSREKALEALTLAGAKMMELDHRVGSLDPGKDADIIVLSGDPFSVYTHVEQTWVEGKLRFDRSRPEDKAYSVGGYQVYKEQTHHELHEGN